MRLVAGMVVKHATRPFVASADGMLAPEAAKSSNT
jgi:hypothetical protein